MTAHKAHLEPTGTPTWIGTPDIDTRRRNVNVNQSEV